MELEGRNKIISFNLHNIAGNMHGDETVGRQLIVQLGRYLLTHYNDTRWSNRMLNCVYHRDMFRCSVPWIQFLVDNTELHLLPSLNPDGFEKTEFAGLNASSCTHA